jgi:hypothetical protein
MPERLKVNGLPLANHIQSSTAPPLQSRVNLAAMGALNGKSLTDITKNTP